MSTLDPATTTQQLFPILRPFKNNVGKRAARRWLSISAFVLFCFAYGGAFSLFAPVLLVPLAGVLVLPALLVMWVLPETITPPTKLLEFLVFLFFGVMILWPDYLAIALPGLPWITLVRLVQIPLAIVLLTSLFVSRSFREHIYSVMMATPWLTKLVGMFVFLQMISIAFSRYPGNSIDSFIQAQIGWTAIFVASCYIFSREGEARKMAGALCIFSVVLSAICLLEYRLGQVPWANHIPHFLQINDPSVMHTLQGQTRDGGIHRVQGTYTVSLALAEYLALVFPFAIYFVVEKSRLYVRFAAALLAPLLILMVLLTQSRMGLVGIFVTALVYPLAFSFVRWRQNQKNILSAAFVFFSPVLAIVAVTSVFLVHGVRRRLLGGGEQQSSTDARFEQVHMGIPKILQQPWGHGIGQGAKTLGFFSPGGQLTIDSYWLRLALEYGVLGLILFIAIFAAGVFYAARGGLASKDLQKERNLFIPIACALLSFVTMKVAFAQENNQPVVFLLLGMLAGQYYQTVSAQRLISMPPS